MINYDIKKVGTKTVFRNRGSTIFYSKSRKKRRRTIVRTTGRKRNIG